MEMSFEIVHDDIPESPREWDNVGTMVCFHKRYNLGDKHDISFSDFSSWKEMEDRLIKEIGAVVVLPLFLVDHSGLSMSCASFADPWDSGQVGFIYTTRDKIFEYFAQKRITKKLRAGVIDALKSEVITYDQYLRGDVWGYQIKDGGGEVVDSCWGFFGEDLARQEAESSLKTLSKG